MYSFNPSKLYIYIKCIYVIVYIMFAGVAWNWFYFAYFFMCVFCCTFITFCYALYFARKHLIPLLCVRIRCDCCCGAWPPARWCWILPIDFGRGQPINICCLIFISLRIDWWFLGVIFMIYVNGLKARKSVGLTLCRYRLTPKKCRFSAVFATVFVYNANLVFFMNFL